MLRNSKLKYQLIKLLQIWDELNAYFADFIASRAGSWKSIDMFLGRNEDQDVHFKIIHAIEPSVEEILIFLQLGFIIQRKSTRFGGFHVYKTGDIKRLKLYFLKTMKVLLRFFIFLPSRSESSKLKLDVSMSQISGMHKVAMQRSLQILISLHDTRQITLHVRNCN